MRSGVQMQKQVQLAFTGYNESNVKLALKTIMKKSSDFDVIVNGKPIQQHELLVGQPQLRGCDKKDLTVFSVSITGSLENLKNLVKIKTPLGVQIDLLPQAA